MYRIGVVGPESSISRIRSIGKEFEHEMIFLPYPYKKIVETEEIVLANDHKVDIWLFSGQISYQIATRSLETEENLIYIEHSESGIYKSLFQIAYYQDKFLEKISIDELSASNLNQALDQLEIDPKELYYKLFDINTPLKSILEFHTHLWKTGKTKAALTCFEETYLELQKADIPAYRISTTDLEIRQTLKMLSEKLKANYFKDMQISVQIVEVINFVQLEENSKSSYHLQYLEIKLKESLIKLCEQIDGSLLEKGNGTYIIFSTRGAIEREVKVIAQLLQDLMIEMNIKIAIGIGFGETAYFAERNARQAIRLSVQQEQPGMVFIQEDGTIVEGEGEEELSYSSRMNNPEILTKLKKGKISLKAYNKIKALVKKMGWNNFTIKDLSSHLNMDERNTRRILNSLCDVKLAENIGEEINLTRGRPSKIYRLI